jgi:hypothetical protein
VETESRRSGKQLDRQKKKEKRQSPAISDHLSKKQMVGVNGVYPNLAASITSKRVARPVGLEPTTSCLEGRRSIQLSYGRTVQSILPSSTYSYFLENFSFKSRCNRCNNGLFGWIFGKIETKSNGLGLSQAHVNLFEQMRVNL